jgi:hypothetical protein
VTPFDPAPETVFLSEGTELGPAACPLLRGATVPAEHRAYLESAASGLLALVEYRTGVGLVAGRAVGCVMVPLYWPETGRKALVRVRIDPAHPDLTFRDVVSMMLYTESGRWLPQTIAAAEGEEFIEVLCRAFANESRRLVRRGPSRTYVRVEARSRSPVGRLDLRDYAVSVAQRMDRLKSRRLIHTAENPYNRIVAAGLYRAAVLATDRALRRQCRLLAQLLLEEPPPLKCHRSPLPYSGQFAEYLSLHDLAWLLLKGSGGDPAAIGKAAFVAFYARTDLLFQAFLSRLVRELVGDIYRVVVRRHAVFEDAAGRMLSDRGYLVPDIEVQDAATYSPELIVDAKYEKGSPELAAADYYQAYVYGDLLGQKARRRPLPVVLASPAAGVRVGEFRRGSRELDVRAERPVVWALGVPVASLLSPEAKVRQVARAKVRQFLLHVIEAPTALPVA